MKTQFDNLTGEINPNTKYHVSEIIESRGFTMVMKYSLMGQSDLLHKHLTALLKIGGQSLVKYVVNQKNNVGWTPLMLACRHAATISNTTTIKILLENGADINSLNNLNETALSIASAYSNTDSNPETIKLLIDNKADLNVQDVHGNTPLMNACTYLCNFSNIETVKLLIDGGANVNLNNSYTTPLYAVINCYPRNITQKYMAIKLLLNNGASIDSLSGTRKYIKLNK